MKCSEIEERLSAYLENFLQNEEKGMIEEHCAQCSNCRGALEDLKRTREILEKLDEVEPPDWLAGKVMAKITEKEEGKGWLQRLFLPLHIKVPVQVLAMALVVVISAYLYKSTAPEPGDLARLQSPPQAAENLDAAVKKGADTKKKSDQAPRPEAQETERKKAEARKTPAQSMPSVIQKAPAGTKGGASVNEADASRTPAVLARKDSLDQAITKETAAAPYPQKAERFKTRGAAPMAAREEKKAEYKIAAPEIQRETPWQIIVTSADPSDVVRKTRSIMISLSAEEVRERNENSSVIISGLIDPKRLSELKDRIAEIAMVHEVRKGTGESQPGPVEIIVRKDPPGR